jgi:vacuolar-type H+-ATPase subunit E/Vma4
MSRPKPEAKQEVLSVQVPSELKERLTQMAYDKRVKFPDLVRGLLIDAVARHEGKVGNKQTTKR